MCSSYSKLLAYEASRILFRLGCDVRVYDPSGLPVKDDQQHDHPKVQELRELSKWSDSHVWVSPEQHGNLVWPPQMSDYRGEDPDKLASIDRSLQESNRLDPPFDWLRTSHARKDAGNRPGKWRLPVLQRGELAAHIGPLDEDVHNSQPELNSESMDVFHGRGQSSGRGQPPQAKL